MVTRAAAVPKETERGIGRMKSKDTFRKRYIVEEHKLKRCKQNELL